MTLLLAQVRSRSIALGILLMAAMREVWSIGPRGLGLARLGLKCLEQSKTTRRVVRMQRDKVHRTTSRCECRGNWQPSDGQPELHVQ